MVEHLPNDPSAITERLRHVAHEMRGSLNAVLGFAQLLQCEKDGVTPLGGMYLRNIEIAALQLSAMVGDLVDLPDLQSGTLSLKSEWVVMDDVATSALSMIAPSATESGVRVMRSGRTAGLTALADRARVLQVLLNLLSNAIKYGRGLRDRADISLDCSADDHFVRLSVQDGGPGLTPEQTCNLFRPFERLGAEHTSTEGTGIGLYISRAIARAMGGDLEVASRPGCGSAFTLLLPRCKG